jgi:hypothetical protein
MATQGVAVKVTADTGECEASLERAIELAERFREVWGDAPRPDGIERLTVAPGDRIVLRVDRGLTVKEQQGIKESMRTLFPDNEAVVLAGGLRLEAVLGA